MSDSLADAGFLCAVRWGARMGVRCPELKCPPGAETVERYLNTDLAMWPDMVRMD
jgi:hypothetical protein